MTSLSGLRGSRGLRESKVGLPLAVVVVGWLAGGVARGESPPRPCSQKARVHPGTDAALPRNAPAVVFQPPVGWWDGPIDNYMLALLGSDGNVVPSAAASEGDDVLVRPQGPLVGAEVSLRYRNVCDMNAPADERRIRLDPPSALPTTVGVAQATASAMWTGASCGGAPTNDVRLVVSIELSPEMAAYQSVARWEITYQGRTRLLGYGALLGLGADKRIVQVAVDDACPTGRAAVGGALTLRAHVAGAEADPQAVTATVSASCPQTAPSAGARCPSDGGVRVPPPVGDAGAAESPRASGACVYGSSTRGHASWGAAIGIGLLALVMRRRHRRSRND
ncbi:MAG TPA: hypothetical protein VGG33_19755 [Polyangia bacterium]